MKTPLLVAIFSALVSLASVTEARPLHLSTELDGYTGNGAYVAVYVTDAAGTYQRTLWVAGKKPKYYKHLRDWARGSALKKSEYDGMTGASILSGKALKVTVELPDALVDAGYQLRVDTAVEDGKDVRAEVIAPLTTEAANKPLTGKGYVKSFVYRF